MNNTPARTTWLKLAALFAATLLLVAACSSSGDDDPEPEEAEPTVEEAESDNEASEETPEAEAEVAEGDDEAEAAPEATPEPALEVVPVEDSVLQIINEREDLSKFAELAAAQDIETVFTQERGVTLFVPNDSAFDALGEDFEALVSDPNAAKLLLSEHLAVGANSLEDLVASGSFSNAMARSIEIEADGDVTTIDGIEIVESDLTADNGIIHIIDGILTPPETE